jgi:hypothetical protein
MEQWSQFASITRTLLVAVVRLQDPNSVGELLPNIHNLAAAENSIGFIEVLPDLAGIVLTRYVAHHREQGTQFKQKESSE